MRYLLTSLIFAICLSVVHADIQDPPANKFGSTRKLSRGVANILYGVTEIPQQITLTNELEGNAAAASFGVISGVRRTLERFGIGVFEVATHPFALNRGTKKPYFKSPTRGVNNPYTEFPPELGFESKYDYVRR